MTATPRPTIEERVSAGIKLLSSRLAPYRCLDVIDTDRLSFLSVHACVLGQIFGEARYGLHALSLTADQAVACGLDVVDGDEHALASEWGRQLDAMRHVALPSRKAVA
jgi:hypothetical protein